MAKHSETPSARARASSKRPAPAAARARRIARKLAQGTLLAAGLAVAQLATPEIDPRFPMFSRTLVDRLQSPVTRHHE
jgi:hypothetical protein